MSITQAQIDRASAIQTAAAHDTSAQIRLVAGPGTCKSYSIGERIEWLLRSGIDPDSIYAVSFTRAAAADLHHGIQAYCLIIYCTGILRAGMNFRPRLYPTQNPVSIKR